MDILSSLKDTESRLKIDIDRGKFPEWFRLKTILNFINSFPDAKIYETEVTSSHHLESSIPSSMKIRRAIPDCRGRLYVSDRRFEMIGSHGDIIYWRGKGKFKYEIRNGKLAIKWTRKPLPDQKIDLEDVLRFPFKLSELDFHRKHRARYWKRLKGKLKEVEKTERRNR